MGILVRGRGRGARRKHQEPPDHVSPMRGLVLALLLLMPLAGCFGGDGGPDDGGPPMVPPATGTAAPTSAAPTSTGPGTPWFPSDGAVELEHVTIASFDGHMIPTTIHRPVVASAQQQVPVLLHSHGFGGARATAEDAFTDHIAAGFGVVSFDERGHGDARGDSEVGFMQPDLEVQDVRAVIDHVATLDWVLLDGPGDPRLGGIGKSYGGAFQLMSSIFDDRFDALAPEITWHNITEGLAPQGAIKSGWVDAFYASGNAQGTVTFNDDFHAGFAWATATNELPAGQAPMVPDLVTEFNEASPESYPGRMLTPTFLVQGMPDTLFPLNHAVQNLEALRQAGTSVRLYTHLGGHVLNTDSLAPGTSPVPVGLQGAPGPSPCGEQAELEIAWHQFWLLGRATLRGPAVCIALEDGTAVIGNDWPLPGTRMHEVHLGGPWPMAQLPAGPSLPLEAVTAEEETVLAGIPRIHGNLTAPGADHILYFSLQMARADGVLEHIIDDQVMPLRIKGPNTEPIGFTLDLGGIGTRLAEGDQVFLVVSTVEPMYMANSGRVPGAMVLEDLVLELPVVDGPVFFEDGTATAR